MGVRTTCGGQGGGRRCWEGDSGPEQQNFFFLRLALENAFHSLTFKHIALFFDFGVCHTKRKTLENIQKMSILWCIHFVAM